MIHKVGVVLEADLPEICALLSKKDASSSDGVEDRESAGEPSHAQSDFHDHGNREAAEELMYRSRKYSVAAMLKSG
jgi:hypothetical protein